MTRQNAVHLVSSILALAGGVLAYADKLQIISAISPELAKYWPLVLVFATVVDRMGKVALDALSDSAPVKLLALAASVLSLSGCAAGHYSGPPINFSGQYITPDGNGSVGASVRLDPTYLRQK